MKLRKVYQSDSRFKFGIELYDGEEITDIQWYKSKSERDKDFDFIKLENQE